MRGVRRHSYEVRSPTMGRGPGRGAESINDDFSDAINASVVGGIRARGTGSFAGRASFSFAEDSSPQERTRRMSRTVRYRTSQRKRSNSALPTINSPRLGRDPRGPRRPPSGITFRGTVIGLLLGALLVNENMYFFLKSGIGFAGCFTSVLLGFSLLQILHSVTRACGVASSMSVQEQAYMVAISVSAAGGSIAFGFTGPLMAMTKAYVVSSYQPEPNSTLPFPFCSNPYAKASPDDAATAWLHPLDGCNLSAVHLLVFCSAICALGIFTAAALRKKLLVDDKLEFPSGTASAALISALNDGRKGQSDGKKALRTLGFFFVPSFLLKTARFLVAGLDMAPIFGHAATCYLWWGDWSTAFVGSSLLIPEQIAASMLAGAVLQTAIASVALTHQGNGPDAWFTPVAPTGPPGPGVCDQAIGAPNKAQAYTLFPSMCILGVDSVVLLVTALSSVASVRSLCAGLCGSRAGRREQKTGGAFPSSDLQASLVAGSRAHDNVDVAALVADLHDDDDEEEENDEGNDAAALTPVSAKVWAPGIVVSIALITVVVPLAFPSLSLSPGESFIACLISVLFSVMVMAVYGATDQGLPDFPGKVAVLIFAPWTGDILAALLLCAVAMCCSTQGMDTLMVMKMGDLLQVQPRVILIGQLVGAFASIPLGIASFFLFTSIYEIPGKTSGFAAPLAEVFRGLGDLAMDPAHVLPKHATWFMLGGVAYCVVWHALGLFPAAARVHKCLPIPFALALGMYIPPFVALDFSFGALLRFLWRSRDMAGFTKTHSAVAAGMISGEGFAAVFLALFQFTTGISSVTSIAW